MLSFKGIATSALNNTFYLHPTKCGGQSVHACLKDTNVQSILTYEIQLNESILELLKSDEKTIVVGHIDALPSAETDEQKIIMSEILKILYLKSDLIMPTRNPSNLLQSWMHYSKTRSNKILQNLDKSKNQIKGKDAAMLFKMSALKQNCIVFSDDGKKAIGKGSEYPYFKLKQEDEERNLLALADFLWNNISDGTLPQLCAMQFQLFAWNWKKHQDIMLRGMAVTLKPPMSSDERKVFYYDCESINSSHQLALDQAICPGFSERLLNTRKNVSEDKSKAKGSDFDSVNRKLQKLIPGEWHIYAMSKVGV